MYSFSRFVCSALIVAAALSFSTAGAYAQEATAPRFLSVDQVQNAFSSAGYQVDHVSSWNWTAPPFASFEVHDSNTGRVVMVLVYLSSSAAQAALLEAETHEQALGAGVPTNEPGSPHLVAGYGRSVWDGNVAMVETTEADIERAYQAQIDLDNGLISEAPASVQPESAVDLDFLQALQQGTVNL